MDIKMTKKVLTVGGFAELTAVNSELFVKQTCVALDGHSVIEIDLSRTRIMDCTGLGALIALRNFARVRNAVMLLVNPGPAVRQLFEVVGAGQMFEAVHTRASTPAISPGDTVFAGFSPGATPPFCSLPA